MKTRTLEYYRENAEIYVQSTIGCMMDEAINEFLSYVKKGGLILDLGCGSGRDSRVFLQKGYQVDPVDGTERICELASEYLGVPVRHVYFDELEEDDKYDGVWACASILHLPYDKLKNEFKLIARSLKKGGAVFASFRYGDMEGLRGDRYFTDLTPDKLEKLLEGTGLIVKKSWFNKDERLDRQGDNWLSSIIIKK